MKPQHSPTPWKYHLGRGANPRFHIQTEGGYRIANTTELVRNSQAHEENAMRETNAAFIVQAVNSYEGRKNALAEIAEGNWTREEMREIAKAALKLAVEV